jgi:hypothetical protein
MALALLVAFVLGGCSESAGPQQALAPPTEDHASTPKAPLQPPASSPSDTSAPLPALPLGAVYVCVVDRQGEHRQTVIEFPSPKLGELCRKNPEMGPCRYERDACRSRGGRVYSADGTEVTPRIETEYDKKVLRATFQSNL